MGKKKRKTGKRKLTKAQRERRKKYKTIFINGKQKRVLREPMIDGLTVDEFIRRNADPIWLHQNGMWEYLEPTESDLFENESESEENSPSESDVHREDPF